MAQKKSSKSQGNELAQVEQKQKRQQRLLNTMEKREQWMKWLIIGLVILVLLLILFLGYATDWTRGLRKDKDVTGNPDASTMLDSTKAKDGANTIGSGANGSNGSGGDGGATTNRDSAKDSSTTSTSNTSTTTNNSTTTTDPGTPTDNSDLISLYDGTSLGDDIAKILNSVPPTVSQSCHTELLVQVCDFTEGDSTVTTKSLLGSGLITSITKNFE